MSGQSGISAVDPVLRSVDLAGIQDERARECIRLLLNLIESLTADLRKSQAENLYLREQLKRRNGGGAKCPGRDPVCGGQRKLPKGGGRIPRPPKTPAPPGAAVGKKRGGENKK